MNDNVSRLQELKNRIDEVISLTQNTENSKEIHEAIRLLNNHGFIVISSDRQINNGTILVEDTKVGSRYTIHKSGYVRKRIIGGGYLPWHTRGLDHYQLNPVIRTATNRYPGSYDLVRILYPGEYVKLANIVVRVATKNMKKSKSIESFL